MGSRGPIANPNSIRYHGKNREKPPKTLADVPIEELGTAKMPSWLGKDGRRFWRQYAGRLEELGRLTGLDSDSFAMVCSSYEQIRAIDVQIEEDGLMFDGPRGGKQVNPMIRVRAGVYRQFLEGCRVFGLSPSSRERLRAPKEKPGRDPFDLFLKGQHPVLVEVPEQFDARRAFLGTGSSGGDA